ncbi:DNA ligase D [Actinosynnema sp. NPDC050436]|uniref:DNA ligase D n=1 Tax=Actinosynnema sp. NPDC050436 TaxID=3155659 RepID=UPI0033CEA959
MLATPDGGRLPSGPDWSFEDKLDGYRCAARVSRAGSVALTSRNGLDLTTEFAELTGPVAEVFAGRAGVLDGEVVAYDEHGRIDFGLLQERRGRHRRRRDLPPRGAGSGVDVRFLAFDLLRLGEDDLLRRPYDERRAMLAALPMPDPYRVGVVRALTYDRLRVERLTPELLLRRAGEAGYEGLVAKLRRSAYEPGRRSESWLKHPLVRTQEVVVCGWRPGRGGLSGSLGGLLLGAHDPVTGDLVYLGDVGTGFSRAQRADLLDALKPLERRTHPFATTPPREDVARALWVEPRLVGEVVYRTFTRAGRLRHTAWRGLREDRSPGEVLAPEDDHTTTASTPTPPPTEDPGTADAPAAADVGPGGRITVRVDGTRLRLSNLDKVMYPATGFTKGEVVHYYTAVAPLLLPRLRGRPVTVVRWPDGVEGQSWFGKNVPAGAPDWLRTVRLAGSGSRDSGAPVEYPLLDDLPSLVWAANLAALELHVPQWTVGPDGAPRPPDRLVIDLDPGEGTTIVDCCRVAERVRDVLVADGLTPLAKTSGSKGMQLYAAIVTDRADAPSTYAKQVAQRLARETPDAVTAVMGKSHRTGRVFLDWSQNNPAKTTVAPYSLRGRDHPTASTPVTWDEVRACRQPAQLVFTAEDVLARMDTVGDLLADLDTTGAPLPARSGG